MAPGSFYNPGKENPQAMTQETRTTQIPQTPSAPADSPIPKGYHTITPYLTAVGAAKLIEFLKEGLGAEEVAKTEMNGLVMNAELRIGDSMLMVSEARSPEQARPATLYLYVENTDALYERAVKAGAKSLLKPQDMFYGDRNGGVQDFAGNQWWIATRIEDVSAEEVARRAQKARSPQN